MGSYCPLFLHSLYLLSVSPLESPRSPGKRLDYSVDTADEMITRLLVITVHDQEDAGMATSASIPTWMSRGQQPERQSSIT